MNALFIMLMVVGLQEPAPGPSVVVLPLRAETGVDEGTANILTELLIQHLRDEAVFSRVVSINEMQDVLSFEKQRQLLTCDSTGCMAEIAGAMGVEVLVSGSVGRLGNLSVISLRLMDVKSANTTVSVSDTVEGGMDLLVRRVPRVARQLLERAHLIRAGTAPLATPETAPPAPAPVAVPESRSEKHASRAPLMAGGLVTAASVPALLVSRGLMAGAACVVILPTLVAIPTPLPLDTKKRLLLGTGGLLGAVAAGAGLLALGLLVGGVTALGVAL